MRGPLFPAAGLVALLPFVACQSTEHKGQLGRKKLSHDVKIWDDVATTKKYFANVISPWAKGVDNPLPAALLKVPDRKNKSVIDLGTGIGNAVALLSREFGKVVAIDFSPKMVETTRRLHAHRGNVKCAVADMRDMRLYRNQFDVTVAVNSLLLPSQKDLRLMFAELFAVTKAGGYFFGIVPAIEGQAYGALLTFERELTRTGDEKSAWQRTHRIIQRGKLNLLAGTYEVQTGVNQKFYYRFELLHRLRRVGFTNCEIGKVRYPWHMWNDRNTKAHEKYPPFWDWFVSCRKPSAAPPESER